MAGRPSKYDPNYHPKLAYWMCRSGLKDEDIAKQFDIGVSTLNKWKNDHPEFMESLKGSKVLTDYLVEDSLLKRALGYDATEVKTTVFPNGTIKTETTVKHIMPETLACIFWLKNRKPELWRDKQVVETTNPEEEHKKAEEYKNMIASAGENVFNEEEQ